jgi:metal-responsive CopG/Arc/MetJ family transcriptional regulator
MSSLNFGLRFPRTLIERADARAEDEDRSRSQVIKRALERDLDEYERRQQVTTTTETPA